MGFQKARGFDALVEDRELDRSLSEKHMIVPLKQLCSALSESRRESERERDDDV